MKTKIETDFANVSSIKLKELINKRYNSNIQAAADAANTTIQTIKNWKCQKREVIELADGSFILKSSKSIIFK